MPGRVKQVVFALAKPLTTGLKDLCYFRQRALAMYCRVGYGYYADAPDDPAHERLGHIVLISKDVGPQVRKEGGQEDRGIQVGRVIGQQRIA